MRYLIIPDIHNEVQKADRIIASEKWDRVIFLGDFFDNFGDTANDALKTAYWLKHNLQNKDYIFLNGNHCLPYRYPQNKRASCSGFTMAKYRAVSGVLTPEDWNKMSFFYPIKEGNWLISHAGLHEYYQPPEIKDFESLILWLEKEQIAAFRALRNNEIHWFYKAGFDRGGEYTYGGLTWACAMTFFNKSDFFQQLVGHSHVQGERRKRDGENTYFLDSLPHLSYYAIIEDGKIEIKKFKESFLEKV